MTFYPTAYNPKLYEVCCIKGSEITLAVDWAGMAREVGATLTATEWHTTGSVTTSDDDLTGTIATALMSASNEGNGVVECWATFNDGQLRKQQIEVAVTPSVQ